MEDVKASVQRVSGWRRPSVEQLARLVQSPRIAAFRFRDDGFISKPPAARGGLQKRGKIPQISRSSGSVGSAFEIQRVGRYLAQRDIRLSPLPLANSRSARYRSRERNGASRGNKGRIVKFKAGDAVVIPAGTGHQCLLPAERS